MKPTIEAEKWYVYRYNHSRHVLKSSVTELNTWMGANGERMAAFEVSGWDHAIAAEMLFDPSTGAWYGESGPYDFRWAPLQSGETDVLLGYATDRHHVDYCDSFLAVKNERTVGLTVNEGEHNVYEFAISKITPFQRGKGSEPSNAVSVDLAQQKILFKDVSYKIIDFTEYDGGLKVFGAFNPGTENEFRIELWILPLDASGQLLATGYFSEVMPLVGTSPGPSCSFTLHACQT